MHTQYARRMPGLSGPSQRGKGWTAKAKPKKKQSKQTSCASSPRRRPPTRPAKRSVLDVQLGGDLSLAAVALGVPSGEPAPEEPGVFEKVSDAAEAAVDKLKDLFVGDK